MLAPSRHCCTVPSFLHRPVIPAPPRHSCGSRNPVKSLYRDLIGIFNYQLNRVFYWFPAFETEQEIPLNHITGGKPLRVWLFYWIPASAGMTNVAGMTSIGFLHSFGSGTCLIIPLPSFPPRPVIAAPPRHSCGSRNPVKSL